MFWNIDACSDFPCLLGSHSYPRATMQGIEIKCCWVICVSLNRRLYICLKGTLIKLSVVLLKNRFFEGIESWLVTRIPEICWVLLDHQTSTDPTNQSRKVILDAPETLRFEDVCWSDTWQRKGSKQTNNPISLKFCNISVLFLNLCIFIFCQNIKHKSPKADFITFGSLPGIQTDKFVSSNTHIGPVHFDFFIRLLF